MPHAVMVYFDNQTEATIRKIWKELDETGAAPYLHRSANRPHFKMAIYNDLHTAASQQQLQSIAATTARIPVHFKSLGIFPNQRPTVFLAPSVTPNLLNFQSKVNQSLNNFGKCPTFDFFLEDHWVPHCLLGFDLEPSNLAGVLESAMHLQLPFDGWIEEIGLVEFHPVKHLFTFPLTDFSNRSQLN